MSEEGSVTRQQPSPEEFVPDAGLAVTERQTPLASMTPYVQRAVALSYSNQEELPRIIATGEGTLAQKIITLAQENGIPLQQNAELVQLLGGLLPGAHISPESFRLVAELVSFLYHVDRGLLAADAKTAHK